jgi:large subunit ribosomal protein L20
MKKVKGAFGARSKLLRMAQTNLRRSLVYAFRDRKKRKGDFRQLWITRLSAALRERGTTYSKFICALKKSKVSLDRKVLAEIAACDPEGFSQLVKEVIK